MPARPMPTQTERIYRILRSARGWVGMPRLARNSGSWNVHSRIADLRARGLEIENRIQRRPGTTTLLSFYRLASDSRI